MSEPPRRWETASEKETRALGVELAATLVAGSVCLLEGEMGAGKTVFVKGLAEGLGIDGDQIQSPTFTLAHHHQGTRGTLIHLDLYRLEGDDFEKAGLGELVDGPDITVVEWADRLPASYRRGRCFIFERLENDHRRIREIWLS